VLGGRTPSPGKEKQHWGEDIEDGILLLVVKMREKGDWLFQNTRRPDE